MTISPTTDPVTLEGVCHFFSETGTEGGHWAFQDARYISPNTTRFWCKTCGVYWDRSTHPDGPQTDDLPGLVNHAGTPFCGPDAHAFELISPTSWSYEGLHVLEDGDHLTIFDKDDPSKVVWDGLIELEQHPLFTEHASGMWIHADQRGVDRDTWSLWFFKEHPAKLVKAAKR